MGSGANGVTFSVTHKILNVKQVIKIYFPKENEKYVSNKAQEEARKNANTTLAGVIAVIFDAGEYTYPCKLWYSIMESVSLTVPLSNGELKGIIIFKVIVKI